MNNKKSLLAIATIAGAFYACSDNTAGVTIEESGLAEKKSSSVAENSSSSEPAISSSSSENLQSSSSKVIVPAGYTLCRVNGKFVCNLADNYNWKGYEKEKTVNFGIPGTDGTWFEFDDHDEGQKTTISWAAPKGDNSTGAFDAIIDTCEGLCGEINFVPDTSIYSQLYAGIGVTIGQIDENGKPMPRDISNWQQICIIFQSDFGGELMLGMTDSLEKAFDTANLRVSLPKSSEPIAKCYNYDDFKFPSWFNGDMSPEEALTQITSIKFKVINLIDKDKGHFNLQGISIRQKGCDNPMESEIPENQDEE